LADAFGLRAALRGFLGLALAPKLKLVSNVGGLAIVVSLALRYPTYPRAGRVSGSETGVNGWPMIGTARRIARHRAATSGGISFVAMVETYQPPGRA
jgi:hypothetical protein